jgi:hypothetical protein
MWTTLTRYFEAEPRADDAQKSLRTVGLSLCLFIFCGMIAMAIAKAPTPQVRYRARPAVLMSHHSVNER